MDSTRKQVAVVVGATSKWQADGRNTKLAHGKVLADSHLPVGVRWGVGGAIAQKFAKEGFVVVLTTRKAANAAALEQAITAQGRQRTLAVSASHTLCEGAAFSGSAPLCLGSCFLILGEPVSLVSQGVPRQTGGVLSRTQY